MLCQLLSSRNTQESRARTLQTVCARSSTLLTALVSVTQADQGTQHSAVSEGFRSDLGDFVCGS